MEPVTEPAVLTAAVSAGPRDRRLTFLTRGRGMVSFYARRSPRAPADRVFLEPLQGGELGYVVAAGRGQGRRFTFVPQRVWPGIREDFERTVHALSFLELVNACGTEGEPQPGLFSLLVAFLDRLEEERSPGVARTIATLHLLVIEGFAPQLAFCVSCGSAARPGEPVSFAVEAGGIVCAGCAPGVGERPLVLSAGAHRFMLHAIVAGREGTARLRADQTVAEEVARFLDGFTAVRFGARPRSAEFLRKLQARTDFTGKSK